jgi:transcriptional regulator with XRE-family HTH domain
MDTRIKMLRERAGLSQGALAGLVGTSQQQIARIETGNQSVKLDLAFAIASVLGKDITYVFPSVRKLIGRGKSKKSRDDLVELHYDSKAVGDFASAGVDLDPATWILQVRMRGQTELSFVSSKHDINRLQSNISHRHSGSQFFAFHSSAVAVALKLDHLLHFHALWDGYTPPDWQDPRVPVDNLCVYLTDSNKPLTFEVDPDEGSPHEEDEGQLRSLLFILETHIDEDEYVDFLDADGERAFFRAADLSMLTIPLRALDEDLNDALVDVEELLVDSDGASGPNEGGAATSAEVSVEAKGSKNGGGD